MTARPRLLPVRPLVLADGHVPLLRHRAEEPEVDPLGLEGRPPGRDGLVGGSGLARQQPPVGAGVVEWLVLLARVHGGEGVVIGVKQPVGAAGDCKR